MAAPVTSPTVCQKNPSPGQARTRTVAETSLEPNLPACQVSNEVSHNVRTVPTSQCTLPASTPPVSIRPRALPVSSIRQAAPAPRTVPVLASSRQLSSGDINRRGVGRKKASASLPEGPQRKAGGADDASAGTEASDHQSGQGTAGSRSTSLIVEANSTTARPIAAPRHSSSRGSGTTPRSSGTSMASGAGEGPATSTDQAEMAKLRAELARAQEMMQVCTTKAMHRATCVAATPRSACASHCRGNRAGLPCGVPASQAAQVPERTASAGGPCPPRHSAPSQRRAPRRRDDCILCWYHVLRRFACCTRCKGAQQMRSAMHACTRPNTRHVPSRRRPTNRAPPTSVLFAKRCVGALGNDFIPILTPLCSQSLVLACSESPTAPCRWQECSIR